jgi:type I phosphodiesterase/nucleotide pyrophosphatase
MISRKAVIASASAAFLAVALVPAVFAQGLGGFKGGDKDIRHVLLVSVDGMHVLDYLNCSRGIGTINAGEPYCPNLAELGKTAVNYLDTSTSKPSDSFPGLMALVTGGSPRTVGAFYDVAYDRYLAPPALTTGNGVAMGPCTPFVANSTRTEYDEGIDIDQTKLNGGAPGAALADGGIASIDSRKLIRNPNTNCGPVFPWHFIRTNTIFGVIHASGGYTAWSDKHPAYSAVSGGNGTNVDDYYSPEINSIPVALPGVTTVGTGASCNPLPDQTAVAASNAWTDSFANIQCYDQLKVNAVTNEIDGFASNHSHRAPVPAILGMNFQVVSVGQKLIEKSLGLKGGYLDSTGTPSEELLSEIRFVDAAIGEWVEHLRSHGLLDSTLIIVTAKHGQSPIDSSRYQGISTFAGDPITTSPATIADNSGCLPSSESPSNANGIGPTEDDVSLLWLTQAAGCTTSDVVGLLESQSPSTNNVAGIGEIFSGRGIAQLFNAPGIPPTGDPRTPDIVVTPNIGVTYSGSGKKQAEHGGFSHDDTNVMMLLSNPSFRAKTVTSPVETEQVAPTILAALGLDPGKLDAVQLEGTQVLPDVPFDDDSY